MTTLAVIPARLGSTRFPGKPLAKATGKYLVQHVYEQAARCQRIDRVVVAADDERIIEAVKSFGGDALMTRTDHDSGTDRIGEVVRSLNLDDEDIVLNVQGDEPEINPEDLGKLVDLLSAGPADDAIATLATPFPDDGPREGPGSPLDPSCVKIVVDADHRALYFSRSLIPYPRRTNGSVDRPSSFLLHLGVYAFRAGVLRMITEAGSRKAGSLEHIESLEQLRWLERGMAIRVEIVQHGVVGIDTTDDYAAFVKRTITPGQGVSVKS